MDFEVDVESDTDSPSSSDQEIQDKFARKYEVLIKKCDNIHKENQMLIFQLLQMKRRIYHIRKERRFLIQILDKHEDKFRNVPINMSLDDEKILPSPEVKKTNQ